ncbi:MAG: NAD(P)/FAD-dependent oxidoreductase [Proteobacteria bacterium]|nr:NAD(P)/FAD-dependent oxidoreductase [Pseudomonadota bacterium]
MRFHREARHSAYDVIVVGAGIGGLTTASLLARRGRHVLLVERHDRPGGYAHSFKRRRYRFDAAVHLIGGCENEAGLIDRLLRGLGVRDQCEFLPAHPFYSALYPGFRLDAPTGVDEFQAAHVRAFPHEEKGFQDLFQLCADIAQETARAPDLVSLADFARAARRVPTLLRYHRATLGQVLDDTLEDPRLKTVFGTLWPYLGLPPSRVSFVYWAAMLMSYVDGGAYSCRGSFQRLASALAAGLREAGGELLLKSRVRRIRVESGRTTGVVLENGQRIDAPVVISGSDATQTFEELVGPEHLPRRFMRDLRAMRPSVSAFVVYGATDLDLRRAGASHEMFVYKVWDHDQDYRNLLRGHISRIGLTVPTLSDPELAPEGEHVFQITVLLPYAWPRPWREDKTRLMDLLLDEAEAVFPGLREHLLFAECGTPRTLERYTLNHQGALYGWEVSPQQVGPLRLAPTTPIEGLHLAGHWTQPGGGVYGAASSGVMAAQHVLGYDREADLWRALDVAPAT